MGKVEEQKRLEGKAPRPRKRRQARALRTRRAILEAAREAFNEAGFEGATIKDIGQRAEVSVGAIYEHFKDKRTILVEVGLMEANRIKDESLGPLNARIDELDGGGLSSLERRELVHSALAGTLASRRRFPRLHATLLAMASEDPEFDALFQEREEDAIAHIKALLVLFGARPAGAEAELAARTCYRVAEGTLQFYTLHGAKLSDAGLLEQLTMMLERYLFGLTED